MYKEEVLHQTELGNTALKNIEHICLFTVELRAFHNLIYFKSKTEVFCVSFFQIYCP